MFPFTWLRVYRQHRLEVGPHHDFANPATVLALGHNVFEIAYPRSPDVAVTTAELFESAAHGHVRPEAVQVCSIRQEENLGQGGRIIFGSRESELSRHQMLAWVKQRRRRRSIGQRSKQVRGTPDLGQDRGVARC